MWKDGSVQSIDIPQVIDDYNHWMGGVNKTDQYIYYCGLQFWCCCVWLPMKFHALDVIKVNAYIIYKSFWNKDHKVFLEAFIKFLFKWAKVDEYSFKINFKEAISPIHWKLETYEHKETFIAWVPLRWTSVITPRESWLRSQAKNMHLLPAFSCNGCSKEWRRPANAI